MEKRHIYISLAVVLGLFVVLASVGFFDERRLTGFAVIGEYENQTDCVGAGYTWEELTEQNCTVETTCVNETIDCEPCLEYEDINGTQGDCITWSSCTEEVCTDEETCVDVVIGGQCVGDVCETDDLTLCLNEIDCVDEGGYWYNDVCNAEAECAPITCETLGHVCGSPDDGCGRTLDCGNCDSGDSCVGGVCEEEETEEETESDETTEDTTTEDTQQEGQAEETTQEETLSQEEQLRRAVEEAEAVQRAAEAAAQPESAEEPETSTQLTGSAVEGVNFSLCEGCLLGGKCYDFNRSKKGSYCYPDGSWVIQLGVNGTCIEDFECLSKSCEEGMCDDYNLLQKIIQWFKRLFSFDRSVNESNQTNYSLA